MAKRESELPEPGDYLTAAIDPIIDNAACLRIDEYLQGDSIHASETQAIIITYSFRREK